MPSAELLELARRYLEIVDSGDPERQGDERTAAHEQLMDAMQRERIPFNARWEARWIARWLVGRGNNGAEPQGEIVRLMFAVAPEFLDNWQYDPFNPGDGRIWELTEVPYVTEDEERSRASRVVPVIVTIRPLQHYDGATYQRSID